MASSPTLDLGNLLAHVSLDASGWHGQMNKVEASLNRAAARMAMFGAAVSATLTYPLQRAARAVTNEYADFDDQITKNMAILEGANAQMRKQYEDLAISISGEMPVSAVKLAEGLFHLAQAGLDAEQSIKAMPIVARFAVAGMMDMETATEYLVQSQNALGLASKDSEKNLEGLRKVSNNVTYASIKTTAGIFDFASALSNYAGQAARLVGKDIEEVTSVLMAFATQGIKGEEAGYRVSMMLRDLQRSALIAASQWELNEVSVYDTVGEMRNVADIIIGLEERMKGLADDEKRVMVTMLGFQDRSLMAVLALMGLGKKMKEWQQEVKSVGEITDKVAYAMATSWKSRMQIMWNSMFPLRRDIGKFVADDLYAFMKRISEVARVWDQMNEQTKEYIYHVGLVAALIGPGALGFALLLRVVSGVVAAFNGLIVATLTYSSLSIIGMVSGLVVAFESLYITMYKIMAMRITDVFAGIVKALLGVSVALIGSVGSVLLFAAIAYTLRTAWLQNVDAIKQRMQEWLDSFKQGFEWLSNTALGPFLQDFVSSWQFVFETVRKDWSDFLADIASGMIGMGRWMKVMASSVKNAWGLVNISDAIANLKEGIKQANEEFAQGFVDAFEKNKPKTDALNKYVHDQLSLTAVNLKAFGEASVEHLDTLLQAVKKQFGEDLDRIISNIKEKMPELAATLVGVQAQAQKALEEAGVLDTDVVKSPYGKLTMDILNSIKANAENIVNQMSKGLSRTSDMYYVQEARKLSREVTLWRSTAHLIAGEIEGMTEEGVLALVDAYEEEQRLLIEIGQLQTSNKMADGFRAASMQIQHDMQTMGEKAYDFTMSMSSSFENGMMNMIENARSWKDAFMGMLREIYHEMLRIMVVRPLAQQLAGGISGVLGMLGPSAGGGFADYGRGMRAVAEGGIFSQGHLMPFANGGIFRRPTLFPMADGNIGLMGEAGPEAVMPLSRDKQGRLGVRGEGNKELLMAVKELIYITRKQKIVQPVVIDRREDMASVLRRDHLRRGDLARGTR